MANEALPGYKELQRMTPTELAREAIQGTPTSSFQNVSSATINLGGLIITPEQLIASVGKSLSNMEAPLPAGKVLELLSNLYQGGMGIFSAIDKANLSGGFNELAGVLMPHLLDDAMIDRNEIIEALALLGHKFDPVAPDAAIVDQSRKMLASLGIEDNDGTLAAGIAKASILGSIGLGQSNIEPFQPYSSDSNIGPNKMTPPNTLEANPSVR